VGSDRCLSAFASTFRRRAVAVGERVRVQPGLERLLIAPAGEDQPLLPPISGLEQLETFKSIGIVDGPCSRREAVCQLVPGLGRHGNGVDLDDGHLLIVPHAAWRHQSEVRALSRIQSRLTVPVKLIASCTSSFGSTMKVTFFSSEKGTAKPTVAMASALGLIVPVKPLCS
jgi:hypothetical protein